MFKFIEKSLLAIIFALFTVSSLLFTFYNQSLMKNKFAFMLFILASIAVLFYSVFKKNERVNINGKKIIYAIFVLASSAFIVNTILNSALFDFFQPYSLYDIVIYISMAGYILIMALAVIDVILAIFTSKFSKNIAISLFGSLTLIFILMGWNFLQGDFDFENIEGDEYHVFVTRESGYKTFRIPTMLVLPKGSILEDGSKLNDDTIIVMAEARRNNSHDFGDIDLVQKRSTDGGKTWSELEIIRQWEDGIGKIGNSTPVFDSETGKINLIHIAAADPSEYQTYNMTSGDGGKTWSTPEVVIQGFVGPGHGIQIKGGKYDGRLVVPGYDKKGSRAIYSDDNGLTWQSGAVFDDGNECEIAQVNDEGRLIITVRTSQPVAEMHEKLHKLFAWSDDGGMTWTELKANENIVEPVCMSSIVRGNEDYLYYSYPNHYYSRSDMTIAVSKNGGVDFEEFKAIYSGAAGYSDLGVSYEGDLFLAFENGSNEYDERITLVKIITTEEK